MFGFTFMMFIIAAAICIFFLLLPILAIIDILKSKFRGNDNLLLMLLVIFIPLGAIVYFILAPSLKIRE